MQRTSVAARRATRHRSRVLRPGPASRAAPAPPTPVPPEVMGYHVAGYVDGAGRVCMTGLVRGMDLIWRAGEAGPILHPVRDLTLRLPPP